MLTSCSEETEVGSGLLGNEDLEVVYSDDFNLIAKTVQTVPAATYFPISYNVSRHIIGELNDPIFGQTKSSTTFVPFVSSIVPDLSKASFDSVVVFLNIDTTFSYGDVNALHDIEVYRVRESLPNDTIYSNQQFLTDEIPLGVKRGVKISDFDSLRIPVIGISTLVDSTVADSNLIRIRLENDFGQELFENSILGLTTEGLQTTIRGLEIRSSTDNGLFGINLPAATFATFRNSISIYYRDSANLKQVFVYPFGGIQPMPKRFENDITGTIIEANIDVPVMGDEALYVQGLSGVKVAIDVSDAQKLEGTLINYASLEFFVSSDIGRDTFLYPDPSVIAVQKMEEGKLVDIIDLSAAKANGNQIAIVFGGDKKLDEDLNVFKYEMNITSYIKDLLKEKETGDIFLSIFEEIENPNTAILFGPNHPTLAAKLKITYTNP